MTVILFLMKLRTKPGFVSEKTLLNQLYISEGKLLKTAESDDIILTVIGQSQTYQHRITPVGLVICENNEIQFVSLGGIYHTEDNADSQSQINKSEVDSAIFEDETMTSEFSCSFRDDDNREQLRFEENEENEDKSLDSECEIVIFPKFPSTMEDELTPLPKRVQVKITRLEPEMSIIKEEATPSPFNSKETTPYLQIPEDIQSPRFASEGEIIQLLDPDSITIELASESEKVF